MIELIAGNCLREENEKEVFREEKEKENEKNKTSAIVGGYAAA